MPSHYGNGGKKTPKGFHRMPSGKLMKGDKHPEPKKKDNSPFKGLKKGALHKMLKIPEDKKIPRTLLNKLNKAEVGSTVMGYKITPLLKKRVNFALNFGK